MPGEILAAPFALPMTAQGVLLQALTWLEAERVLTPEAVVVLPLGAAAKEHGPHLRLDNDWTLAEYLKRRVLEAADVVVAPTIGYHYYPAFVEYPGSVSLRLETARDLVADICRSFVAFGPKRYYVLNTGVSTLQPLKLAQDLLAAEGMLLHFTDTLAIAKSAVQSVQQQEAGTHADEIETSMMLYIAPERVDMRHAARDIDPGQGRLRRERSGEGIYSATGIYGDATLATREKGRVVVEAKVAGLLRDIEALRRAPLPG